MGIASLGWWGEENHRVSGGEVGSLCLPPRFGGEEGAARRQGS